MSQHDHPLDEDECSQALAHVQAFLHGELDGSLADRVRAHLDACEACLDAFDVESAITRLIQRCCKPDQASSELRLRIMRMRVEYKALEDRGQAS